MSIDVLSRYWKIYVKPDFVEYQQSEDTLTHINEEESSNHDNIAYLNALRHAKHVIVGLNQMSDYVCNNLEPYDSRLGGNYGNTKEFRVRPESLRFSA